MIRYNELLKTSLRYAVAALFRPFALKKWLLLSFAMIISASYVSGCGIQFPGVNFPERHTESSRPHEKDKASCKGTTWTEVKQQARAWMLDTRVLIVSILILGLLAFLQWLHSRFVFVFLHGVAHNDASIRKPFRESARMGDSYFLYSCALFLLVLAVTAWFAWWGYAYLKSQGVFAPGPHPSAVGIIFGMLSRLLLWFFFLCLVGVFSFFVRDLCTVIMYKEQCGVTEALRALTRLFRRNPAELVVYALVRGGLSCAAGAASWLTVCLIAVGMAIPLTSVAIAGSFAGALLTRGHMFSFAVYLLSAALLGGIPIMYALLIAQLPFAVFMRMVGMQFLARVEPAYDVMNVSMPQPAAAVPTAPAAGEHEYSAGLAGLLSFYMPGLGQIYNGEYAKGISVFISSALIVPWALGIIDAYQTGGALKQRNKAPVVNTGVLIGFAVGMGTLSFIGLLVMFLGAVFGVGLYAGG